MSDSVPEYYRHLAEQRAEEEASDSAASRSGSEGTRNAPAAAAESLTVPYRADAFQLDLPAGAWTDRSVYTLTGPTVDGIQHNITVLREPDVEADTLHDFAGQQMAALALQLDGCQVLLDGDVQLASGRPAYRVIYTWQPNDDLRLYQEQIYVLHDGQGYTLTASFTRSTRKQLGAEVERMMRSFDPLDGDATKRAARTTR